MRGKVISISLIALFALSVFIGCGTKETPLSVDSVFADTDSDIDVSPAPSAASTTLTDAEKEGILYMREEEKLARDVYIALGEKWSLRNFSNIASSEQTHMNAVKTLIDKYGLDDPIEGKNEGEFTNGELQDLYDNLIEQGMKSPEEALKVGAAIEEIDIIDLQNHC